MNNNNSGFLKLYFGMFAKPGQTLDLILANDRKLFYGFLVLLFFKQFS
ncbi:MAG TPA: hypothetical protein VI583_16310 [Cyclobacteriaceae bacterium]|nr:hypothetical protein [Cyclobacteriaceae bacterium]